MSTSPATPLRADAALPADTPAAVLSALRPAAEPAAAQMAELPLNTIDANAQQPRTSFDDADLDDLTASVRAVGVLQPIVVRPAGLGRYELVMGERRLRAARGAGLATIPALIRPVEDREMLRHALLENIQRAPLNPLEEAAAYKHLLTDFDLTHEDLGAAVGKSRSHISHTLSLLRLPAPVQRRVAAGVLSAGHARALVSVGDPYAAEKLAERIVAEGLSVRQTEEIVALGNLPGAEADDGRAAARRRLGAARQVPVEIAQLADDLSDQFETRVRIQAGRAKGRIVVEFGDRDDLHRILAQLRPTPPSR